MEKRIRPWRWAEKNYHFAGSYDTTQWAAILYSFFATCQAHDIEPRQWLKTTLGTIPEAKVNNLKKLFPTQ
ncbi:transposase domain-containing protein [Fulvivirga sediminis]|uniref:Transposase domain-containing protein n=1 Tax=Fulvivirga sediminis TaxID=2803949 RepID=A0A937FCP2_9BACT|nr:transposase domain-containing protein [Fulvivirga sediminis]MBL3658769.1 transposase domain-containing protein [Fulvivirga sediminis]